MCTDHHDGTCSGVLARSQTEPGRLVMSLVCESCSQVVKALGTIEHTFAPLLGVASPQGSEAAQL